MNSLLTHYLSDKVRRDILSTAYLVWTSLELFCSLVTYFSSFDLSIARQGYLGFGLVLLVGLAYGFWHCRPFTTFVFTDHSGLDLAVRVGDVFEEHGNLVVGMSDCFDTKIGTVISQESLQGQLVGRLYGGDVDRFEKDVKSALKTLSIVPVTDPTKKSGKCSRYPLGTTIVLSSGSRKIFAPAYATMGSNLMARSTIGDMWKTLGGLWDIVRANGDMQPLVMPIIGTDRARVEGVNNKYQTMAKLILLSYVLFARTQPIAKSFILMVSAADASQIDFYDLRDFLTHI